MTEFNPLTEFRINYTTLYYLLFAINSSIILIGILIHLVSKDYGYRKGLGLPIMLGPSWLGKRFCINRVFIQTGEGTSIEHDYEYLMEAHIHVHPKVNRTVQKLFKITKSEYEQLEIKDNKGFGVFYEYTSRVIHPGADEYYFERIVE